MFKIPIQETYLPCWRRGPASVDENVASTKRTNIAINFIFRDTWPASCTFNEHRSKARLFQVPKITILLIS